MRRHRAEGEMVMSAKKGGAQPEEKPSFEAALARLEQIVQDLEGGDLTLEETLARYEEGSRLAGECARRLEEAEQRIRVLSSSTEKLPAAGEGAEGADAERPDDGLPF